MGKVMIKPKITFINYIMDLVNQESIMIMVKYSMKENIITGEDMEKEKNTMNLGKYYMKVNGQMVKEMEKEKNIMRMVK